MKQLNATKAHVISYLLSVRGPMTKDELLQAAALVEGKLYKKSSNSSYFAPRTSIRSFWRFGSHAAKMMERKNKASLVANGTIKVVGKSGQKHVYGLDVRGAALAAEYRQFAEK
jgi:hypothetical protein